MKKTLSILIMALITIMMFVSCNPEPEPHNHNYAFNGSKLTCVTCEEEFKGSFFAIAEKTDTGWTLTDPTFVKGSTVDFKTDDDSTFVIFSEANDDVIVNAPNAEVHLYGEASSVNIKAVKNESAHIYGAVKKITLEKGHLVAEAESKVENVELNGGSVKLAKGSEVMAIKIAEAVKENVKITVETVEGTLIPAITVGETAVAPNTIITSADANDVPAAASVAKIGEKYFDSLEEAVIEADAGAEIILLSDVALSKKVEISKNLTIDGNGKTISGKKDNIEVYFSITGGTVSISNALLKEFGNEVGTQSGYGVIKVEATADKKTTVKASNLTISKFNRAAFDIRSGNFEISDCKIDCAGNTENSLTKGVLAGLCKNEVTGTVKNTTISRSSSTYNNWSASAFEIFNNAEVSIENCTVSDCKYGIWVDNYWAGTDSYPEESYPIAKVEVTVTNSSIQASDTAFTIYEEVSGKTRNTKANLVLEGTIETNDLASAVKYAADGATIKLADDVSLNEELQINKKIILDGNGKKLTSNVQRKAGILVQCPEVTIQNLTVVGPNTNRDGWNEGEYGIKVWYVTTDENKDKYVTLENVSVTGANAGILVNGNVVVNEKLDVSENEFGGIEISKSSTNSNVVGKLTLSSDASIVCTSENASAPAIWIDQYGEGKHYTDVTQALVNEFNKALHQKQITDTTNNKYQMYLFLNEELAK